VKGVQARRLSDTPLSRVVPSVLHILLLGPPVDLYKDLVQRAARRDGVSEKIIAALEVVAACEESICLLKKAETLIEVEVKKLKIETKKLKEKEDVECDKMPSECRSHNLSWSTAESRGASLAQFTAWTSAYNLRVNTENEMKAVVAEKSGVTKDITKAEEELQVAENAVAGEPHPMTDGIPRGLRKIEIDTTIHFGGESFAGGGSMKLLENRDPFFAEVLRELPGDDEAASIRDIFLPLMALMEELAHEGRLAKVSQRQ
jgi:hypothetical protein